MYIFAIGDRVSINSYTYFGNTGTVMDYDSIADLVTVEMDPFKSWLRFSPLELDLLLSPTVIRPTLTYKEGIARLEATSYHGPSCQCGSDSVGSQIHSTYCPKWIGF